MPHIALTPLPRRTFLCGVGATLALPFLDAMRPVFGAAAATAIEPPRRMLAICTNLGVLDRYFYPTTTGRDYALTPYLEILKDFREQFTIFSGTSLSDVTGGHSAEATFLTGAPHPGTASFRNSVLAGLARPGDGRRRVHRRGRIRRDPSPATISATATS